jgi:phosphate/sulfate permease
MNKVNSIFQLLVALYFGVALVYFLTFDRMWSHDLTAEIVVIWFLVGLVLFIISWGVAMIYAGKLKGIIKKLEMEKKELKAMVFDMERGMKIGQMDKQIEADPNITDADDKEASSIKPRKNIK